MIRQAQISFLTRLDEDVGERRFGAEIGKIVDEHRHEADGILRILGFPGGSHLTKNFKESQWIRKIPVRSHFFDQLSREPRESLRGEVFPVLNVVWVVQPVHV